LGRDHAKKCAGEKLGGFEKGNGGLFDKKNRTPTCTRAVSSRRKQVPGKEKKTRKKKPISGEGGGYDREKG